MATGAIGGVWLGAQRWGLLRLGALANRVGRGSKLPGHLAVGVRGELEALFFLRRQGYTVVARRWRSPELHGDLDLVGWDGDALCFVEVKTRTARDMSPAESSVNREKKQMVRQMARAYLRRIPREERPTVRVRFDLVTVYLLGAEPEIEVRRNAFAWR
jgi:putative endonuclease